MSWVYWGIVVVLVVQVAVLFVCMTLLNSNAKESPKVPNGKIDAPKEAVTQASAGYRRAA